MEIPSHYPQEKDSRRVREIVAVYPDRSKLWAYFDRALTDSGGNNGGGFIIHLSTDIYFHVFVGFGVGSNNYDEILAYWNLLAFSIEQGASYLQIYGDLTLVVNWLNNNLVENFFYLLFWMMSRG